MCNALSKRSRAKGLSHLLSRMDICHRLSFLPTQFNHLHHPKALACNLNLHHHSFPYRLLAKVKKTARRLVLRNTARPNQRLPAKEEL